MSCQLADLPAAVLTPPGFSIRLVSDLGTLHTWVKTFLEGYGLPPSFEQPFYDLLASLGVHGDLQHYLGWLDGVPVAASSIFYSAGVAGIYNVGVVEPARGQGLGAAITLAPLLEARQRGYPIGALQSSEMGFNVYRRLGFRKVCDVRHFSFSQTPDIHRRVSQVSAGEPPEQSSEIT
jgi:GNAT superfamily N-acetyltransferase